MFNPTIQLTEFDPNIIFAFEPESSHQQEQGSTTLIDCLFPSADQYQDMLDGYLYAQTVILPKYRELGRAGINKQQFLEWISVLHSYIGKTVIKMSSATAKRDLTAGVYTDESILRWHNGAGISDEFIFYFSNLHPHKNITQFTKYVTKTYGITNEDISPFIKILNKIHANQGIPIHPSQSDFISRIDKRVLPGVLTLNKLQTAYNTDLLSQNEKDQVDKIVKICIFPTDIPAAMDAYATKTLLRFNECNETDLDQISAFLAESFHHLVDVHPFANGNGRVATCMMNIFLRCFNLPSILLRYPGEKGDGGSDYSIAIAQIDKNRQPLQDLIKKRIISTTSRIFSDKNLEQATCLRVEYTEVLKRILSKHPSFDIESIDSMLNAETRRLATLAINEDDSNMSSIIALPELISIALREEKRLDSRKHPTQISVTQRDQILTSLHRITGASEWKFSQKNGLLSWIQLSDQAEATMIADRIKRADVATITLAQRKDDLTIWVVRCDDINFQKLIKIDSVAEVAEAVAAITLKKA